jgi:hypothetical protein
MDSADYIRSSARRYAPQQLKIVAYLFMLQGFSSMASIIESAMRGKININLGVLLALIGWGLLKLNPNSYRWAKFSCHVGLWLIPIFLLVAIASPSGVTLRVFVFSLSNLPRAVTLTAALLICALGFCITRWMLRVLESEPVRWVFLTPGEQYIATSNAHD